MLAAFLPFLISTNSFGIIAMLILMGSSVIFTIPVFASRGTKQALWFGVVGFLLTVELVVLVTLGVLVNNGDLWRS
jgi:hypothetical protein